MMSAVPAITSVSAGADPLYGTWVNLTPVTCWNSSPARWVVVPEPAVTRGQEGSFVYVVKPDSTVATRPVTIERSVDELVVVANGLEPGEIVITDGQLRLSPGARVIVRTPEREGEPAERGARGAKPDRPGKAASR